MFIKPLGSRAPGAQGGGGRAPLAAGSAASPSDSASPHHIRLVLSCAGGYIIDYNMRCRMINDIYIYIHMYV